MKALNVARYIVEYVKNHHSKAFLSHIKLQKIMYYCYAEFLKRKDLPLFQEKIEKWQYGPVIREVYDEFKSYGSSQIHSSHSSFGKFILDENGDLVLQRQNFSSDLIDKDRKSIINNVVDSLITREAFDLVEKTHREISWKKYENLILSKSNTLMYTDEEIKKFSEDINT
ncbi:DUF4065 domain-containing protein [Acinetobacter sp. 187]|uniref:Panacea domain-containing protein n=1 Tax=Acinetobacter lanii TaxID=2715163 RepID=UPI00140BA89D|nr:type II toxin-antitoxin system antitoxin SocA domain-containing protein [Acinetobacter lanii]NHC02850.1 DUF4065 domain-containing protein [Acinetobacter lanii]